MENLGDGKSEEEGPIDPEEEGYVNISGGAGGGNKMMKNEIVWMRLSIINDYGGIAIKCTRGRGY